MIHKRKKVDKLEERHTTDWEKKFANHFSENGLIEYVKKKQPSKLNNFFKKADNSIIKWTNCMKEYFTKEDTSGQMRPGNDIHHLQP